MAKEKDPQVVEEFNKITVGYVVQYFKRDKDGLAVCTGQDFCGGDDVEFEDADGKAILPQDDAYQTFDMTVD